MAPRTSQNSQIEMNSISVHFDPIAFAEQIGSHGVVLEHWQCYRCPVGMVSYGDNRAPHGNHSECENGLIYEYVGPIKAILTSNSKNKDLTDIGYYDQSPTYATFQVVYEGDCSTKPFLMTPLDRFYLSDTDTCKGSNLEIPVFQYFEASADGIDRLKYPVKRVLALRDNNNATYTQDVDFVIKNGAIYWLGNRRPAPSLGVGPGMSGYGSDRGAVCSVRYTIRPYYYVHQIQHDLRMAQVETTEGMQTVRMPQSAIMFREYVHQNKTNNPAEESSDSLRLISAPPDGGYQPK